MYGGGPDDWSEWGDQTSILVTEDDYIDQQGGGQMSLVGFDVQVRDCSGNSERSSSTSHLA
jgi:hypothetical protein